MTEYSKTAVKHKKQLKTLYRKKLRKLEIIFLFIQAHIIRICGYLLMINKNYARRLQNGQLVNQLARKE